MIYFFCFMFIVSTISLAVKNSAAKEEILDSKIKLGDAEHSLEVWKTKASELKEKVKSEQDISALKGELKKLEESYEMMFFDYYKPKYGFENSSLYKIELDKINQSQKSLIKDKKAVVCDVEWQVQGSKKEGKKVIANIIKLITRAFNSESDNAISKVKYNNVYSIESKIERSFESINRIAEAYNCRITREYLNLKLKELYLVHEYKEKRQEEKEEQRRIKEEMREEQKVLKEIEEARKAAEKEKQQQEKNLSKMRAALAKAKEHEREILQEKVDELEEKLKDIEHDLQNTISMAQLTKAGHVYIISNIGSFGEGIYKIGMTRRLEPLDRIKELGSASVPFQFDVHAMIYSTNAPEIENALHKAFDHKRVNRVNNRKEFFNVSLDEIADFVKENLDGEVEITKLAEAEEYRKSQSIAHAAA